MNKFDHTVTLAGIKVLCTNAQHAKLLSEMSIKENVNDIVLLVQLYSYLNEAETFFNTSITSDQLQLSTHEGENRHRK